MCATHLLSLALWTLAGAQQGLTLAQELARHDVPRAQIDDAGKEISSYAVANDAGWFGIAYYWSTPDGMLPRQLRVRTYDKRAHRWRVAELDAEALQAGSATRVARAGKWVYIDTHITPSAGSLLVLTADLRIRKRLYGWTMLVMPDGRVVYHNSMVHFAPVHAGSLSIYDPVSGATAPVYPRSEDQVRDLRSVNRAFGSVARLSDGSIEFSVSEQDVVLVPDGAEPVGPSREFRVACDVSQTRPRCVPRLEGP